MRARSRKQAALYVLRRRLVAELLEARPVCERCRVARSVDLHEVKTRARGGSILSVPNIVCLCRECHDLVTRSPRLAVEEGFMAHSWETPEDAAARRDQSA